MLEFVGLFVFNMIVLAAMKRRQDEQFKAYAAQLSQTSETANKIASIITEAEPTLLDKISNQTKQLTQKTGIAGRQFPAKMTEQEFVELRNHCRDNGFQDFTVASIRLQMPRLTYRQFSYLAATCTGANTPKLFNEWEAFHASRGTDPRL